MISPTHNPAGGTFADTFAKDDFELSDFSDYKYQLTDERMTEDTAATEKKWNIGATAKASGSILSIVDVRLEVSGDYKNADLRRRRPRRATTKLTSTMEGIDESFGETAYMVKPFAYWTPSATLVLDYAVEPSQAQPGDPKTWWQLKYGSKPDLTLNLPRLYDFEEQAGISSDAARFISPGVEVLKARRDSSDRLHRPCAEPHPPARGVRRPVSRSACAPRSRTTASRTRPASARSSSTTPIPTSAASRSARPSSSTRSPRGIRTSP